MVRLLLLISAIKSIDSCIPTSPAAMPPIPCASCDPSLVTVSNFMYDANSIVNGCLMRTIMCPSPIDYGSGVINTGPATLAVTCNAANTAWMFNGVVITQASCSRCQDCLANLLTRSTVFGNIWSEPAPSFVNGCIVRKLTCTPAGPPLPGMCLYVTINSGSSFVADTTLSGMVTMEVTCNDAATAFVYQGPSGPPYAVTAVNCMNVPTATCTAAG